MNTDYWNSFHQSQAIAGYSEQVTEIDDRKYEEMLEAAREYNNAVGGDLEYIDEVTLLRALEGRVEL